MSEAPLVQVRALTTVVRARNGDLPVVQDLDLEIGRGETVALVGESGCGKSLTALSLMGLLPADQLRLAGGEIRFGGVDLAKLGEREMARLRGRELAMIFQDPMSALNPVLTVGCQIEEAILAHERIGRAAARDRAIELLRLVRIPDPAARLGEYPHRLSGGMCQRICIAMAIACRPRLLIADEPTTALDVTIQAQVLQLLRRLKAESDMSMLFITHDLGVVAEMADRVAVMYAGRIVEMGAVRDVFRTPRHPYTAGLLALTMSPGIRREGRLAEIPGMVPPLDARPPGCGFAPRCGRAHDACAVVPALRERGGHLAACWAPIERVSHGLAVGL